VSTEPEIVAMIQSAVERKPDPVVLALSAEEAAWLIFFLGIAQGGLMAQGERGLAHRAAVLSRNLAEHGDLPGDR
jgi:hypothetical protein